MDLVYHVMKSPLILSDQIRPGSRSKMDLRFTQKLCKIGKSTGFDRHQDDTDAIINDNIVSDESQRHFARYYGFYYFYNRKENSVSKKGLLLATAIMILALITPLMTGTAEEVLPPSPEPPSEYIDGRPTPAPSPVPDITIIDHVHNPESYPRFFFQKNRKLLEIWFPNIRDADEAILMYDGQVWMIDCGDEKMGQRGAALLKQLGITKIDILFNSHLHHDHINGLALTDDVAKVGEVRICFSPDLTDSGLRMLWVAEERGILIKEYRDGDRFSMGDGAVELLFLKNNEEYLDMNNQSAVTRITYGERTILFTADMEQPGQQAMIERIDPELLKCDIVKYPHHAKSDMYTPFYEALGAGLAVVTSVEGRGDAGQIAIANRGMPAVYTSVKDQFTHLVTDGEYWLVEQVPIQAQ